LIGQGNRAQSAPATLRRVLAAAASGRPAHSHLASGSPLNQRAFIRRVLAATSQPGNAWRQRRSQPQRRPQSTAVVDETPPVILEPESGWWALYDDLDDATVTVAVLDEPQTGRGAEAAISRLAQLAAHDELLVVYGAGGSAPGHHAVTAGLRSRLPRRHVVALQVCPHDGGLRPDAAVAVGRFLNDGSLPVLVTPVSAVLGVTAEISSYLRADRVLRVADTSSGAALRQVWRRQTTAQAN
jgi:hypothetical protein